MTRAKMLIAAVAATAMLIATSSGATTSTTAPGALQAVIVTLRTQADLSGIKGARAARLREVVKRRQVEAERDQRPFGALVKAWQHAGRATRFQPLWIINGFALTATPDVINVLAHNPAVASVSPDQTMYAPAASAAASSTEWNVSMVNAPSLWNLGDTGQGVVVASLDTGVSVTHPDLASRWRGGTNSWYDPFNQHPTTPTDLVGHGTQVTGIMVGGNAGGTSVGVAPGAQWIAARIYNDAGQGSASTTHLAFQWLLDPDGNPSTDDAPQVVNNSWTYSSGCNLEFATDIQTLRAAGILPVFAAGNYGGISASPANNPGALAVGATNNADAITSYSSRGPSACGEPSNTFPELTAPGESIRSTDLYGGYTTQSGTSLAAPHVAGALALLLSVYPTLTVAQQESALELGAKDLGTVGPDNTYGYGRLDVLAAYNAVGSPSFALDASPSSASTTAGGGVSYTVTTTAFNGFVGDVSLSVSGLPVAGSSWAFNPATITGGAGASTLTVTTSASLAVGSYPFTITGTSGALSRTVNATLVVTSPPDFAFSAAPSSANTTAGGAVSYTVAVSPVNGFAGSVNLSLSGLTPAQASWSFTPTIVPGGSGSSQLTITASASVAAGSYPLTITGTSGSLSHVVGVTLVVTTPDFSLSAAPSSASTTAGGTVSYTVAVSSVNGFAGSVNLSLGGLTTAQATWSFTPTIVPGGSGNSQLTITTSASLASGSYPLTVTGASGALSNMVNVTLVVSAGPDFALVVSPVTNTVKRGFATAYTVTLTALGGFSSRVTLSVSGLPGGVTGWFSPRRLYPPGTSTLTVSASSSATTGTFTITISGTGGSKTHTKTATLTVVH